MHGPSLQLGNTHVVVRAGGRVGAVALQNGRIESLLLSSERAVGACPGRVRNSGNILGRRNRSCIDLLWCRPLGSWLLRSGDRVTARRWELPTQRAQLARTGTWPAGGR